MKRSDKEILSGHFSRGEMPKKLHDIFRELSHLHPKDYESYERALACCITKLNELRLEREHNIKIRWGGDKICDWLGLSNQECYGSFGSKTLTFFDHVHFRKHKGTTTLISEPYNIDLNTLKEITAFCDKYKLYFYQSWINPPIWFPNRTLALCFNREKYK